MAIGIKISSSQSIDGACDPTLPNLKTLILRTNMESMNSSESSNIVPNWSLENLKLIIKKDFNKWLDEAETRQIWTPDVKRVEFFEFNGNKPKLVINWLHLILKFYWERSRGSCKLLLKKKE